MFAPQRPHFKRLLSPIHARRVSLLISRGLLLSFALFGLACEDQIIYQTSDLKIDLNTCFAQLGFGQESGCSTAREASREGCLLIANDEAEVHRIPIQFTEEGVIPLDEGESLIGPLSFSMEGGGELSVYLFGQPHRMAPNRCELLTMDSACDGDCKLMLSKRELALSESPQGLVFAVPETQLCRWESAESELIEVMCDQLDNDCDQRIDESEDPEIPSVGDTCSFTEEQCTTTGTYQCQDLGDASPTCDVAPPVIEVERCDGIDNDCNGEVDEGFNLGTACEDLEGICRASGQISCVLEADLEGYPMRNLGGTFCRLTELGTEQRSIEREMGGECDLIDNDCDGFVDEHYSAYLVECGEGACADEAFIECQMGELVSLCRDGEPTGDDNDCNQEDDDCDGRADESYLPEERVCGVGACRSIGSAICTTNGMMEICTPNQGATQDNDCDGIDDDCDALIDEDYTSTMTTCGIGECRAMGLRICQNGVFVNTCTPLAAQLDNQCDGLDNDCDDSADEGYLPITKTCGVGVCESTGRLLCLAGEIIDTCQPNPPFNENDLCDGFDYDCDGFVDEDHETTPTTCGVGACTAQGNLICQRGQVIDTCTSGTPQLGDFDALCDTVDSDCDGRLDEGYVGVEVTCGAGACVATGVRTCVSGDESGDTCIAQDAPGFDDQCDGIDNDCDGQIDEAYIPRATGCGLGVCAATGVTSCVNGQERDSCDEGSPLDGDSSCDVIDSDCDGRVDEGYAVTATSCGQGVCARQGLLTCVNGAEVDSCSAPISNALDNQCDGTDNDCDGLTDEGYANAMTQCGLGACRQTGQLICVNGQQENTCIPLTSNLTDHRCDGIDQDCDGETDEAYVVREVSCGQGACLRLGETACVDGDEQEVCVPGQAAPNDADCDQVDDDCDAQLDEDYEPVMVTCMMNACSAMGEEVCTNNGISNTCVLSPAEDDPTCNGVDDDCDGDYDEDYEPPIANSMITCGQGVCLNTNGQLACIDGSVLPVCEPLPAQGADDDCDGLDEDCDGLVDEDYSEVSICGVGDCQVTSEKVCVNQQIIDLCQEGDPTSPFDICGENRDNNCDGQVDTYNLGAPCTITQNTCSSAGVFICNENNTGTECNAPDIETEPEVCNGVDDDCDGIFDEEVVYNPNTCNAVGAEGECAQGTQYCGAGGDTLCQPGDPTAEIACNNADEDCDGIEDEEEVEGELRIPGEVCNGDNRCTWQCDPSETNLSCRRTSNARLCD